MVHPLEFAPPSAEKHAVPVEVVLQHLARKFLSLLSGEELGDVPRFLPGIRHTQIISVLLIEIRFLLRVGEQVLTVIVDMKIAVIGKSVELAVILAVQFPERSDNIVQFRVPHTEKIVHRSQVSHIDEFREQHREKNHKIKRTGAAHELVLQLGVHVGLRYRVQDHLDARLLLDSVLEQLKGKNVDTAVDKNIDFRSGLHGHSR